MDGTVGTPEPERTDLQRRVLIAANVLSAGWLSYQPDIELLNSAMALEVLLGEPGDAAKKFRLARRVSYFVCGYLTELYTAGTRPACALLALPLKPNGHPGKGLEKLLKQVREGDVAPCTQFQDVLDIYDARNDIVHSGRLRQGRERPLPWFVAARLWKPVLAWFAEHPDSDLSELDDEIAFLPGDAAPVAIPRPPMTHERHTRSSGSPGGRKARPTPTS